MIKINGTTLPTPSAFECDIQDIQSDDSGRNANGLMCIDRVAVKRKLVMSWNYLSTSDMSKLLTLVQDVFFTVTYPDAMTGKTRTGTFYVGDRSAPMYYYNNGSPKWESVTYNLIEQ